MRREGEEREGEREGVLRGGGKEEGVGRDGGAGKGGRP